MAHKFYFKSTKTNRQDKITSLLITITIENVSFIGRSITKITINILFPFDHVRNIFDFIGKSNVYCSQIITD